MDLILSLRKLQLVYDLSPPPPAKYGHPSNCTLRTTFLQYIEQKHMFFLLFEQYPEEIKNQPTQKE